ncbi:hypothetical protein THAOC_11192, partial [Thalassiosira oceanica]
MVRRAIDKARKEAWIRYVADFDGGPGGAVAGEVDAVRAAEQNISMEGEEDVNVTYTSDGLEEAMLRTDPSGDELISIGEGEARRASGIIIDDDGEYEDLAASPSPETIRGGPPRSPLQSPRPAPEKDIVAVHDSSSRSSVHSTLSNGMGNHDDVTGSLAGHGWSVPLGVHRITAPGGLVVTQDGGRRTVEEEDQDEASEAEEAKARRGGATDRRERPDERPRPAGGEPRRGHRDARPRGQGQGTRRLGGGGGRPDRPGARTEARGGGREAQGPPLPRPRQPRG